MCVPYASTCTGSSRLAEARPVRSPPNSCFNSWIAPCMRRLSSLMSCVGFAMAIPSNKLVDPASFCVTHDAMADSASSADDGGAPFPAQHRRDCLLFADREHDDRHTIFPGKREGSGIHHFQVALDCFLVGQAVIAFGVLVLLRIGAVDSIDVGRLEYRLGADLCRGQHRG